VKPDGGHAEQAGERKELEQLAARFARLRMERDILKKAAAFFARDHA